MPWLRSPGEHEMSDFDMHGQRQAQMREQHMAEKAKALRKEKLDNMAMELAQHPSARFDKLSPVEQAMVLRRLDTPPEPETDYWD